MNMTAALDTLFELFLAALAGLMVFLLFFIPIGKQPQKADPDEGKSTPEPPHEGS